MAQTNPKIASKTLRANQSPKGSVDAKPAVQPKQYETITDVDNFTGDLLYHCNYLMHDFVKLSLMPTDHVAWRYYPNAEGGPVYIDYPQNPRQRALCVAKAKIMAEQKKRYVVYQPADEQKFDDLRDELEEL